MMKKKIVQYKSKISQKKKVAKEKKSIGKISKCENVDQLKKTKAALQAAEELSRQHLAEIEELYRNVPVGLCTLDINLRFLRINERLAEINGIPAADHIGNTVRELLPALADVVEPGMHRTIKTGEPQLNIEIVSETPAQPGFKRTWQEQWLPIKDIDGRVMGLTIIVEEITKLKKAEKEVIDAHMMTQSLINHTPAIVYAFDQEERFMLANTALADLLNSTPGAMIGKRRHEFMPKDDADWHEANDRRVFTEGRPIEFEEYSQLKDRSITWLTLKFPLLDSQGRIYAVAGISSDISDRKQAEVNTEKLLAEIQTEKERLATLINNIPDEVWIADLNMNFILMNSISRQQFGLNKNIIGIDEFASSIEILRPDYSPRPLEEAPALLALKGDIVKNLEEIIRIPASGELRHRQVNSSPVKDANGKITGSISIVRDITERKKAEEILRQSEERSLMHLRELETIYDSAHIGLAIFDRDLRYLRINERMAELNGIPAKDHIGKTVQEVLPNIATTVEELAARIFETGEGIGDFELEAMTPAHPGIMRSFIEQWMPIKDEKGEVIAINVVVEEITQRKKAEQALLESKIKLDLALENANIGLWEWNLKTNEILWDERTEIMFGLQPGSFGQTYSAFEKLINDEDISHVQHAIHHSIEKDLPLELIFRTKPANGKTKYISSKGLINRDNKGHAVSFSGVCSDVTSLKEGTELLISKLNEELLRSNKELENFAYVASHDLQEPLRMVTSFTQLLEKQYKDKLDENALEYISFAVDGSKRMYNLLNGLLAYSRINTKGKIFTRVDLNTVLESVTNNLSLKINESNTTLKIDKLPEVFADESQMAQLFQNLISNSIKFSLKSPRIFISSKSNHDHYLISVKDEGIGIESPYFEKIFQIFQRLHERDKYEGIGIGLAICKRIVERHQGKIWVESEPGEGSAFYFIIPKN
jgi:PAS domain S-box-containing protein